MVVDKRVLRDGVLRRGEGGGKKSNAVEKVV